MPGRQTAAQRGWRGQGGKHKSKEGGQPHLVYINWGIRVHNGKGSNVTFILASHDIRTKASERPPFPSV